MLTSGFEVASPSGLMGDELHPLRFPQVVNLVGGEEEEKTATKNVCVFFFFFLRPAHAPNTPN